jgi:hypothetical protein
LNLIRICLVSAWNTSAISSAKEFSETVTLIHASAGSIIQTHILGTACANSCAISCSLPAGKTVARARLAFQCDIIEPLPGCASSIQHALCTIVDNKELGFASQTDTLAIVAGSAVLAKGGAWETSLEVNVPCFHREVGLALKASLIICAILATSDAIYYLCYIK